MKNYSYLIVLTLVIACKKPPSAPEQSESYKSGILALNEGLFEQNNASITFYSYAESADFQLAFQTENERGLGDTANDFEAYELDGEAYIIIAVDVSSQVEIIERYTLKTVARIPLFNGETARSPRRVKVKGDKAYVCNFDGTVAVIDLRNHTIVNLIEVGQNPDGMLVLDDRLYVTNSGGLNFPDYDNTISVIDLNSQTLINTIETRINCSSLQTDEEGDIYVVSRGNYDDISPALLRINSATYEVEETIERPVASIKSNENWLYFYDNEAAGVFRMNTLTETIETEKFIDASDIETFYGIHVNPAQNRLFLMDANGYVNSSTVHVYDLQGDFKFSFTAGLNATDLIFN